MLNFPNESRSFDAKSNRVQFWGYDGAIEVCIAVRRLRQPRPKADRATATPICCI